MYVRRVTAIREMEAVRELLEEWIVRLGQPQTVPVLDGLGNVIGENPMVEVSDDVPVEEFIGEQAARAFASELVVAAHKLEGLAST